MAMVIPRTVCYLGNTLDFEVKNKLYNHRVKITLTTTPIT